MSGIVPLKALAGWINQQREVLNSRQSENRVLREQLGPRRLRFTDDQCVRLAAKPKRLGRQALREIRTIVSSDTLLTPCTVNKSDFALRRTLVSVQRPAQSVPTFYLHRLHGFQGLNRRTTIGRREIQGAMRSMPLQ